MRTFKCYLDLPAADEEWPAPLSLQIPHPYDSGGNRLMWLSLRCGPFFTRRGPPANIGLPPAGTTRCSKFLLVQELG